MMVGIQNPRQVIKEGVKMGWPFSLAFGGKSHVGCCLPQFFPGAKSQSPYTRRNQVVLFLGETEDTLSVEMNLGECQPWTGSCFWLYRYIAVWSLAHHFPSLGFRSLLRKVSSLLPLCCLWDE